MRQLVYVSKTDHPFTQPEVNEIAAISQRNNQKVNVTGCMIYAAGYFLQLLEGAAADVEATYRRISADPRHYSCIILMDTDGEIEDRLYDRWFMSACYFSERAHFPASLKSAIDDVVASKRSDAMKVHRIFSEFKEQLAA